MSPDTPPTERELTQWMLERKFRLWANDLERRAEKFVLTERALPTKEPLLIGPSP